MASGNGRLDILGDVLDAIKTQSQVNTTLGDAFGRLSQEVLELWQDNADLRDELHETVTALTNRIEALTRTNGAA